MASMYKTPGVYIEEIPKFPPSIAAVETAIPAFIGYTMKAARKNETLLNKPTRIESIAEFEEMFGDAPPQKMELYLDDNNAYLGGKKDKSFLLYDSLRMFYANGGGNAYIVSVGSYTDLIDKAKLISGINALEIEDEPTIILVPDAVNVSDLHDVHITALAQCNKLQDRVALCDLQHSGTSTSNFADDAQKLRDKIGINNLKYGAAYGPWLNSSLPRTVLHRHLTLKRNSAAGTAVALASLTTDPGILQLLADVTAAEKAVDAIANSEKNAAGAGKTWADEFKKQADAYDASTDTTLANLKDELQNLYAVIVKLGAGIKEMCDALPAVVVSNPGANQTVELKLKADISQYIASAKVKAEFDVLAAHYNELAKGAGGIKIFADDPTDATTNLGKAISLLGYANSAAFTGVTDTTVTSAYAAAANDAAKARLAKDAAMKASTALIAFYRFAQNSAAEYEKKFNDGLLANFGLYKSIINKAAELLNLLPPSGAIAGVYSAVDRNRGVWKAPANVSLNAVISPAVKISEEQQGQYNVDVNAGKSINIIRSFTGKGTLVWGARTLAGNDNEWRYVNVRRFFNFVEESVKKATEQFVFEPNDANTWVRVQAMIENFLTVLWRQGALQGIKPEHAFYVAVGLGKTMTPLDILEGRMIIEIGMAAVRPAEFIILKFSHKMAES